ncbi:Type III restriction modification system N6-adenine DNA methyltransferase subunit, Mod [Metamycoplasma auris 15026]|uniref:Type III restriction modification system N6-adenine DNA methyltransferase subunit, Mod n=2 Tax=Metamycoplasma auris TaxID=51363 RepID=N9VC87_9BACT|nr:Type III restriction modification system N6-adenine DNA methyltransferase subunit, Mod [Metamycoplasma auris 15026]
MSSLKEEYLKKAEELKLTNELNGDQKDLIKLILGKFDDNDKNLQNVYQFLIKRIKLGFVFDVAPSVDAKQIALLKKNDSLSFGNFMDPNQNYLIIGENYDALKNLLVIEREREREQTSSKFDVIYIDPPYNTESSRTDGNNLSEKDDVSASKFIYRDKFSRTGWLNMLNERLIMARQLLKEDGVIFVSIDDSEQAYLKVLMDEIFGEENFVANIIWQKKNTGGGAGKANIDIETEFILVYSKNKDKVKWNKKEVDSAEYTLKDEYYNERGFYKLEDIDHRSSKSKFKYTEGGDYLIEAPDGTFFKNYRNIKKPKSYVYLPGKQLFDFLNKNGFIEFKQIKKDGQLVWKAIKKVYEKVIVSKNENNSYDIVSREKGNNFSNIYNECTTTHGTQLLISILNNTDFETPKPLQLLKFLINLNPKRNARVLDFYAGSGTTGHAVMELNKQDGGNRSYTLVTNNENNIGKDICYERLHRINKGLGTNGDSNFKWIKKNNPYDSNLNVFEIEYFDSSIFSNADDNEKIKKTFIKELQDFDIKNIELNNLEILRNLNALKPISKDKDDATN